MAEENKKSGAASRFGWGLLDPVYAASDALSDFVWDLAPGVAHGVDKADAWLHDKTGGVIGTPMSVDTDDQIAARNKHYTENMQPDEGTDYARTAGRLLGGGLPAVAAGPVALATAAGVYGAGHVGNRIADNMHGRHEAEGLFGGAKDRELAYRMNNSDEWDSSLLGNFDTNKRGSSWASDYEGDIEEWNKAMQLRRGAQSGG